jgi:hypothetical protein
MRKRLSKSLGIETADNADGADGLKKGSHGGTGSTEERGVHAKLAKDAEV